MSEELRYVCLRDLAAFLSGFLSHAPGEKRKAARVRLERIPAASDLHEQYPCIVCGGGVAFEVTEA